MPVAALITEASQIDEMIGWGQFLADSEKTDLQVIVLQKSKNPAVWVEMDSVKDTDKIPSLAIKISSKLKTQQRGGEAADLPPADPLPADPLPADLVPEESEQSEGATLKSEEGENTSALPKKPVNQVGSSGATIRILKSPNPQWSLVEEIATTKITLLLLPETSVAKHESETSSWLQSLYLRAPCETIQIDSIHSRLQQQLNVLVTATGGAGDSIAIQRGMKIARNSGGSLTVSYFEPNIDEYALEVGKKILKSIVENATTDSCNVDQQVVVADNYSKGLGYFDLAKFNVVICGTQTVRESDRFIKNSVLKKAKEDSSLLSVRKPIPLSSRFVIKLQQIVEGFVPQLSRDQRIDLVQRIQSSSQWNFDFCIMICLSTLIAALGLIQDSVAVVIGAMLVAPLMTPIVGVGLGLAQTNVKLMRTSLRTVWRGFATAFFIGVAVGLILRPEMSGQMESRGSPNFLDLIVALVSGIAAAYAMGRPNLLSALPGVAIAAALVPPLATSGVAFSAGEFHLSYGSMLLFLTNIVAIVLGTTITFWLVGVRRTRTAEKQPVWPLWVLLLFVILTIGLTVMMSLNDLQQPIYSSAIERMHPSTNFIS